MEVRIKLRPFTRALKVTLDSTRWTKRFPWHRVRRRRHLKHRRTTSPQALGDSSRCACVFHLAVSFLCTPPCRAGAAPTYLAGTAAAPPAAPTCPGMFTTLP